MIPIGSPKFIYRPLSQTQRDRLSIAQLKRLGIPEGYRQIYGTVAPEPIALVSRGMLSVIANTEGRSQAENIARKLAAMSIAEVTLRVATFFEDRANSILRRREQQKAWTRERSRLVREEKRRRRPAAMRDLNLDDAMLLYDEGISPEQISKALRLPLTKIREQIRATRRKS